MSLVSDNCDLKAECLNARVIAVSLSDKLKETENDLKSLQTAHRIKGDRILQLEAEVLRLKMLRSDEQNRVEVEALRKEVSKKDHEVVRLSKLVTSLQDREKELLFQAREADRRADESAERLRAFQNTCEAMQRDRDGAIKAKAEIVAEIEKVQHEAGLISLAARQTSAAAEAVLSIRELAARAVAVLPSSMRGLKEVRDLDAVIKGKPPQEPQVAKKGGPKKVKA